MNWQHDFRHRASEHRHASDLWPYHDMPPMEGGRRMGHEAIGFVEAIGVDARTLKAGHVVIMPV